MTGGRSILLALVALGTAGCDDTASQPAQAAPPAGASPVAAAKGSPSPAPSSAKAYAAEPTLTTQQAEQAFAETVTAVARGLGDDDDAPYAHPDDVFVPLRKAGLAGVKVDGEADYYAWVRPRRPLRFFGHEVALVFAEEMRGGFIGCCVNQGVTLVLRKNGDLAGLRKFADDRRCKLEEAGYNSMLDSVGAYGKSLRDRDDMLALSCHERDITE